ncbi:LOW QUALITY PROTEIN: rho guanine nucleotide exchange factor 40 [Megalops cyprinoides]|uniref:LOW QUALITY PROTEIN: rho guanine nucleotide exchange factor 40 n=1 Tax=Megalops cyprinoides TaxID=118141 RepID=UPI001864BB37|nr:LOW QUALITY PROTEIN: rho guanine nucleotide exchange factor 40 [Megalops cyprinoides]
MGSEAVEDCVQGALSSLYPPFESTAPPLLSQVFSVLESTYQHDSLRYLLDYFIPAKHLLQRLQQHACSQYLGCLFLHSGWPLCLGDKVVVQLSTLDWRLLRSTDFYLQVVPFSTRCPRLALKCLAPGGRNVQEVLVPESQHPLVFTPEWLHSINKERGFKREGGGGLDTCLVSTCEGVVRLPWEEVVYPKFVSGLADSPRAPPGLSPSLGRRSSCELEAWSWDEDEPLPPDGAEPGVEPGAEPGGEYVELLEPRDGPEGGVDGGAESRHRYLEMHGVGKPRTLPLCRRGRALRLRRGKAWAHSKHDTLGARRPPGPSAPPGPRATPGPRPPPDPAFLARPVPRGPAQERRPGVGREREGKETSSQDGPGVEEPKPGHSGKGQSDDKLPHSDPPVENTERLLVGGSEGGEDADRPLADVARGGENTDQQCDGDCISQTQSHTALSDQNRAGHKTTVSSEKQDSQTGLHKDPNPALTTGQRHAGTLEDRVCLRGREVKTAGFRAPRRKRKGKGGRGKAKSGGRVNQCGREPPKPQGKAPQDDINLPLTPADQSEQAQPQGGRDDGPRQANEGAEQAEPEYPSVQSENSPDASSQSAVSLSDHSPEEATPAVSPDQSEGSSSKSPPLLRELDPELLQSGWLILTGTVDRMGRALVITEAQSPPNGYHEEELTRLLTCYHAITRPSVREKGLTVIMDSRLSPPPALCVSALKLFQGQVPAGLGSVLVLTAEQDCIPLILDGVEVHTVRGTGVLQQFVDRQQLPTGLDGDFQHSHSEWLSYRLSLERLTERCQSALSLLEEALRSVETQPLPQCTKAVSLCMDKHKQLMAGVLADQRLTELQRVGGAWLAGLTNKTGLAQKSPDCRAALAVTSDLYNSVDDALHRLVRVSNQRSGELEALGRLAALEEKLDRCEREVDQVQDQLEEYRDPPLSLSRLSLKQHKFKAFRETAMELHRETHTVIGEIENWAELEWAGLAPVLARLPSVREKLRDMSHCLSDCWAQLDTTLRLLSTLTEASQWCDVVSATPLPPSSSPLTSLPPIPPSRFHDARALALELGGGPLLDLWSHTLERYQTTLGQFKARLLQAERGPAAPRPKATASSSMWDLLNLQGEAEWEGEGEGALQTWGSLASLFRPQNCSTLKIGDDKKREGGGGGAGAAGGGAGAAGGGKFLQALLHPAKKTGPDAPLPPKPPRRRHPSFDLQVLLAPRRAPAVPRPGEGPGAGSRASPLSWLGRRALADPVLSAGVAAALPMGGPGGGGVLIRGVEVSSKEVVDHTGSPRQHVLLSRAERETAGERQGPTAQSKINLLCCKLLSSERQYVAVLKGVEENYLPLLDSPDTPAPLQGKSDALFANWSSLSSFHSQYLLPSMEGALTQTLLLQDCFSKYKAQFLQYSHYIRTTPDSDSLLLSQAADFFKAKLPTLAPPSALSFPLCLQAPLLRLEQYCQALEELGGLSPASDSALSALRHIQQHGEDLRASDLITGCPVPVSQRGELMRQGELLVCGGSRRRKTGMRRVFLYQQFLIITKTKTPSPGRTVYSFKHSIKAGEMGLTQSVGEEGLRFEVWVRQAPRTRDCLTFQAASAEEREAWTHDVAQLLWTHAIHNTELCLKESLCMGVSSKLLLDVTGTHSVSDQESNFCLNDRVQSSSDSSSVGSQKEGGSPASGREKSSGHTQNSSPSTTV